MIFKKGTHRPTVEKGLAWNAGGGGEGGSEKWRKIQQLGEVTSRKSGVGGDSAADGVAGTADQKCRVALGAHHVVKHGQTAAGGVGGGRGELRGERGHRGRVLDPEPHQQVLQVQRRVRRQVKPVSPAATDRFQRRAAAVRRSGVRLGKRVLSVVREDPRLTRFQVGEVSTEWGVRGVPRVEEGRGMGRAFVPTLVRARPCPTAPTTAQREGGPDGWKLETSTSSRVSIGRGNPGVDRGADGERVGERGGRSLNGAGGRCAAAVRLACLVKVVDEVAARSVGAEPSGVISATQLRLVLGVPRHNSQVVDPVSKLALVSVLAHTVLLIRPTQLRLVATGAHAGWLGLLLDLLKGGAGLRVALGAHDYLDRGSLGGRERAPSGVGTRTAGSWRVVDTWSLGV